MTVTRWLALMFLAGLILVVIGCSLVWPIIPILCAVALMLPAPTLGLMAAMERSNS